MDRVDCSIYGTCTHPISSSEHVALTEPISTCNHTAYGHKQAKETRACVGSHTIQAYASAPWACTS